MDFPFPNMHVIDLPFPKGVKRKPQSREDWGDQDTAGVFCKERDYVMGKGKSGRYLGFVEGKPTIRVEFEGLKLVSYLLQFETIEEMKQTWWLD
jgi:hypothetical protein